MPKTVVVNTSYLIALDKIVKIDLLCKLYDEVLVPLEVQEEFSNEFAFLYVNKKSKTTR
jgi:predicted nucleic acid-binding protein